MKIYTKTGDTGETGMMGGKRLSKDSPRIQAQGDIDELNAMLGVCRAQHDEKFKEHASRNLEQTLVPADELLQKILHVLQQEIFILGADISTPLDSQHTVPRIKKTQITQQEKWIDEMDNQLESLRHFILPGGSIMAANLHLARTVCRRTERSAVTLSSQEKINPLAIIYLNRLSDLLFIMARFANKMAKTGEEKWLG